MKGEHKYGNKKGKKQKTTAKLKKELWEIFRHWIYIRDNFTCFTCGKTNLSGVNCQAGHFIKASVCGIELNFHIDNIHTQCSYCNLFLDGNQYIYGIKLGKKIVKELNDIKLATKGKKWSREEYLEKIAYYKELLTQS